MLHSIYTLTDASRGNISYLRELIAPMDLENKDFILSIEENPHSNKDLGSMFSAIPMPLSEKATSTYLPVSSKESLRMNRLGIIWKNCVLKVF